MLCKSMNRRKKYIVIIYIVVIDTVFARISM